MTSLMGESKVGKGKIAVSYNTAHRSGCKVWKTVVTAVRKMWIASKHASLHRVWKHTSYLIKYECELERLTAWLLVMGMKPSSLKYLVTNQALEDDEATLWQTNLSTFEIMELSAINRVNSIATASNTGQVTAVCLCLQQALGWLGSMPTFYWWGNNSTNIYRPEDRSI